MKAAFFLLLFYIPFISVNAQVTIHVPADQPTIQEGINVAVDGDIVLVADGTYYENINFKGKAITVASHLIVDGNFTHVKNTIINGSQPTNPDSGSVVAIGQDEDTTSVLQGFTITGGSGTFAYSHMCGGGIFIELASPKILNNIVEGNIINTSFGAAGGGILANILNSPLLIKDNIVRNNLAKSSAGPSYGGGISIWSHLISDTGKVIVSNNIIENNSAISPTLNQGGGISVYGYDDPNFYAYVINNKIIGNMLNTSITQSYGGGITLVNTHAFIKNNIIAYNSAYEAAGIDNANLGNQSNTFFINNIFCYNQAVNEEGAISTFHEGQMLNCIVWGNTPNQFTPWSKLLSITHSVIGEPYPGVGNIEANPLLQDTINFLISSNSPCIDAGNPDPMYNDVEDPNIMGHALYPAMGSLNNDIGHFGGPSSLWGYWEWPLPVELVSFTARTDNQKVILKWTTATELNNNGFEVQRGIAESDFATIGFVKGEGTTTNQKDYSYIDKDLVNGKYFYRLKQIDYNGSFEYSDVVEVEVLSIDEYSLEQNFPNPFNPSTTIGYILKEKSNAKLILLNAIGEEVAALVNEEQDKGYHKIDFNASTLASGVYFYQLQAGSFVQTRKMILLK